MITHQEHRNPPAVTSIPKSSAVTLTIVGRPEAAAGAVAVHVLSPAGARCLTPQADVTLLTMFSMQLQYCAEQYAMALAEDVDGGEVGHGHGR